MVKTVTELAEALPNMTIEQADEAIEYFQARSNEAQLVGDTMSSGLLAGAIQQLRDRILDMSPTVGHADTLPAVFPPSRAAFELAADNGVDITLVEPANGQRIIKPDVQAYIDSLNTTETD